MSGPPQILPSSFRDPRGFVFRADGVVYRQVNQAHRDDYERLLTSGLYEALTRDGTLIEHREMPIGEAVAPGAYRVLQPELVPFVSYPYEWSYSQLREASLATLRAQAAALDHGMSLRDASAYNVQFVRGRPVLIDTLSFEALPEGKPWVAYRQFCQHFVAPLALMSTRDVRLGQLLKVYLDGIPLDLASELLPASSRRKAGLTMHLRLHAKSQSKHQADEGPAKPRRPFSAAAFRGLIDSLRKLVEGLSEPSGGSAWRDYYRTADHYSDAASAHKEELVASWIDEVAPSSVWDLGANTGRFARLASSRGIRTVAFDVDPFVVEAMYRQAATDKDEHLLPLLMDLTNPSPGIGWMNAERSTLPERGPADLALALALVHHLAIGNNVPIPMVVDQLATYARGVIVEWVPKDDAKVQQLLRSREDIFETYRQAIFESALAERFTLAHKEPLADSGRVLYLATAR